MVNIWDLRSKNVTNRIEPCKNDEIARPELGKWIGAVCINDDWLVIFLCECCTLPFKFI